MVMDATSEALKFQIWLLKVSIHCEGCRRKVKKALQSIDGVFTTTVDSQQHKVTVTGNVGVDTLIRKLAKAGKHAEVWPENLAAGKGNHSDKVNKKKKAEQSDSTTVQNHSSATKLSNKDRGIENAEKCNGESKKNKNSKTGAGGKSPAGGQKPETNHKGGKSEGGTRKSGGGGDSHGGKKKKKKVNKVESGETGSGSEGLSSGSSSAPAHTGSQSQCPPGQVVGQVNLSPTRQQSYMYYPETCYTPLVHYTAGGYNRLCPSPMGTMGLAAGPSYYVPPLLPYMFAEPYQFQSPPLISFEIFSDENANGCSVM